MIENETDWFGLYGQSWKGLIVDEAFAHPAKFSRGLIRRIYEHASEEEWLVPGSVICDPFGGVALGGFEAAWRGAHWIGCELESKFVGLGNQNVALWQERFGHMATWGSVRIVQGDSRRLSEALSSARLCVSSPPYEQGLGNANEYRSETRAQADSGRDIMRAKAGKAADARYSPDPANLGNLPATEAGLNLAISSPPYAETAVAKSSDGVNLEKQYQTYRAQGGGASFEKFCATQAKHSEGYGFSDGQLSVMKDRGFDLAVSSPPFVESLASDDPAKRGGLFRDPKRKNDKTLTATYGTEPGQLGAMKDGGFDLVVGSPPYARDTEPHGDLRPNGTERQQAQERARLKESDSPGQLGAMRESKDGFDLSVSSPPYEGQQVGTGSDERTGWCGYTDHGGGTRADEAQLSAKAPDDFWSAARQILEETYKVLAPGAHAIWVLKGFVRKGKYVDFPDQWRQLCESVGFKTLHWHRCWLTEAGNVQANLLGEAEKDHSVERKSFFRRLAESKGSPRIDWEVVLCQEKACSEDFGSVG